LRFKPVIHAVLVRVHKSLQSAMSVREKPPTDRQANAS
jgi:hypothetical protein